MKKKLKSLYLPLPVSEFTFNIAGASYKNNEGVLRQELIKNLKCGEILALIPELSNKFSDHAIAVVNSNGDNLGYVPDWVAEILTRFWERGVSDCSTKVSKIVGGSDGMYFGCVVVCRPKISPAKKVSMSFDFTNEIAYIKGGKKK